MTPINFRGSGAATASVVLGWVALVLLLTAAPMRIGAQSLLPSGMNPLGQTRNGLQLYSVSGFAGWESMVIPPGQNYPYSGANLQGDETWGGGLALGWSNRSERNNVSLSYSANYVGQIRYSQLSALNQSLSLGASRKLSPKWNLSFGASAGISTYNQMLFTPTLFSSLAAAPGSFDDLAAAVLSGKYNNDQLASLLTGAPAIESPSRTYFFGNRVFGSSGSLSLGYAHSQRLTISLSASGAENRHLNQTDGPSAAQSAYLIPRAISASAGVSVSYSLTPRTQVGLSMGTGRGFSELQQAYSTSGSASISRAIGQHWYAQVSGGAGFVTNLNSRYASTIGTTPSLGASLGYRARAHTLMASYDRTLGQSYGIGVADTISTSAAWNWWQPGRSWGLSSMYMRQQLRDGVFGGTTGWRAAFGLTRRMGRHFMFETGYTYAAYSGQALPGPHDQSQSAVRVSVIWVPQTSEGR